LVAATLVQLPQDVSRRALSLARMVERLEPGKYQITLIKPASKHDRWAVEISQSVTIQKKDIGDTGEGQKESYQSTD
jgi:hypothetical protein